MRLRATIAVAALLVLAVATFVWTRTDDCGDIPEDGGWFAYAPNTGVVVGDCAIPPDEVERLLAENRRAGG